jgi:predicted ester cyclase
MSVTTESTTIEETHKQIVRRWVKEVFNEHNLDAVETLKVPEYIDWDPYPGQREYLSGFKSVLTAFFEAFPNFRYDVEHEMCEGDMLVCLGRWSGTNTGTLMGIPPTNRHLSGRRIDVVRFSGDKMSERWGTGPELQMLQLMGIVKPAEPLADDDPKTVCERFIEEVLGTYDPASLELLVSPEGHLPTRDALALLALASAFSDVTITTDDLIAEGDQVMAVVTFTGTHTSSFLGYRETGRRVSVRQVLNLTVKDGRVAEGTYELGLAELVAQIARPSETTSARKGGSDHARNSR